MAFSTNNQQDEVMSEINMTPLVDVMLVLLIIFIITMPVMQHSIKLNLPQARAQAQSQNVPHVQLSIDTQGQIYWNDQAVNEQALTDLIEQTRAEPNTQIHVRADKQTAYQHIASVMARIQNAGIQRVSLVTQPE